MKTGRVCFIVAAVLTVMLVKTASAHLCILKHGTYDLNDPYVCDRGDGARVIDLEFYNTDSELELDVVFQQDPVNKMRIEAFATLIKFDPSMASPAYCNCHDARPDKTTPPPGDLCDRDYPMVVCGSHPVIWNDISSKLPISLIDDFIAIGGGDYYVRAVQTTVGSNANSSNHLVQSLVFKNIFPYGEESFTFEFVRDRIHQFLDTTLIMNERYCDLISENCGASIQHKAMASRVNIKSQVQFAQQPKLISVSCSPKVGCDENGEGMSDVTINFESPDGCKLIGGGDADPADCSDIRVKIVPTYPGLGGTFYDANSPHVVSVATPSIVSFDLIGVSKSAMDSAPISTGPISCGCAPPVQRKWYPAKGSIISSLSPVINFETDRSAWCRWSLDDLGYDDMADNCIRLPGSETWHRCETSGLRAGREDVFISCSDQYYYSDTSETNQNMNYRIEYCVLRPSECNIRLNVAGAFTKYGIVECSAGESGCLAAPGSSRGFKKSMIALPEVTVEMFEAASKVSGSNRRTDANGEIGNFRLKSGDCAGCVDLAKNYEVRARIPASGWDEGMRKMMGCAADSSDSECIVKLVSLASLSDAMSINVSPVTMPDFSAGAGGGDIGNPTCRPEVHVANLQPLKHRFGANMGDEKYHPAVDFNMDGKIDIHDLQIMKKNFGKPVPVSASTKLCDPMFDAR